jgi:hypothetical protein
MLAIIDVAHGTRQGKGVHVRVEAFVHEGEGLRSVDGSRTCIISALVTSIIRTLSKLTSPYGRLPCRTVARTDCRDTTTSTHRVLSNRADLIIGSPRPKTSSLHFSLHHFSRLIPQPSLLAQLAILPTHAIRLRHPETLATRHPRHPRHIPPTSSSNVHSSTPLPTRLATPLTRPVERTSLSASLLQEYALE